MSYELSFHPDALAEWKKLDGSVREVFKKNFPNGCITLTYLLRAFPGVKIVTKSNCATAVTGWYMKFAIKCW